MESWGILDTHDLRDLRLTALESESWKRSGDWLGLAALTMLAPGQIGTPR
jgi:hypothetical protein